MKHDAISFDRMSPDSSLYVKGLRLVKNLLPYDGGAWREVGVHELVTADGMTFGTSHDIAGAWSDPSGDVFVATSEKVVALGAASRIYLYNPLLETLTNVTPGNDYVGAPQRWRFTKFGASVIASPDNLVGAPVLELQVRTGSGDFADLVTSIDRPAPRFVGVSRSYLVWGRNLAVGGAGVYASANPYQYGWSARNDAAVHTPGVDRSNFGFLSNALGEITGIAAFEEFWVIFQEMGVTRLTWTGGDAVWEKQEIASHSYGLRAAWSDSIVAKDRDVYYFSNSGPAMIAGGEAAQSTGNGEVRRFFMDKTDSATFFLDASFAMHGTIDPLTKMVVWTAFSGSSVPTHFQIVLATEDGRFSILDEESDVEAVGVGSKLNPAYPLGNLLMFQMNVLDLEVLRLQSLARNTAPVTILTARWRPQTGGRYAIHALRVLLILDLNGGAYPTMQIRVRASDDPRFSSVNEVTISADEFDDNGWVLSSTFPMEGNEFDFLITIPTLGAAPTIRELPALEIAFEPSSVF